MVATAYRCIRVHSNETFYEPMKARKLFSGILQLSLITCGGVGEKAYHLVDRRGGKKGIPRADELVRYYWELKGER
jgi:ribosomal protein L37E